MPTTIHLPPLDDVAHATSSNFLVPNRIPGNQNLNNYTTPGMYYNDSNAETATIANTPVNLAFSLLVERTAGTKQTFTQYYSNNPKTWVRTYYNGTWGSWIEQADSLNVNDLAKIQTVWNAPYSNLNSIWKPGFYDVANGTNTPNGDGSWFWVINAAHRNNSENYRYGMQIAGRNGTSEFYIRNRGENGSGTWYKIAHSGNVDNLVGNMSNHLTTTITQNIHSAWSNTGIATRFFSPNQMTNQPSSYGNLLSVVNGGEKSQLWFSQASGTIYHRQGNGSGWSGSEGTESGNGWKALLDQDNYNSYIGTYTNNAISSFFNSNIKTYLLTYVFPVGSIYCSTSSTSPASFLGGSWTQIKDKFLLSSGSRGATATGGEETHTLTVNEMPSHKHSSLGVNEAASHASSLGTYPYAIYQDTASNWTIPDSMMNAVGGGAAHNNMPPYYVVNMWRRTA